MSFKKFLTTALAGAMALSLAAPALAASSNEDLEDGTTIHEIEVGGSTNVPVIKISAPVTSGVIVNPYRLTTDATEIGGANNATDQIISPVQNIENKSDMRVDIKATVIGAVSGECTFAAAANPADATKKEANVVFEMMKNNAATAPAAWTGAETITLNDSEDGQTTNAVTLEDKTGTNKYLVFHLTGSATAQPDTPWTEEDTVSAYYIFEFTAKANDAATPTPPTPAADVTASITGGNSVAASSTLNLTAALGGVNAGGVTVGSVSWSSDDTAVATVDASGVVTGVAAGSATITATITGSDGATYTATLSITVS